MNNTRNTVEYFDTPDKSENDKKLYKNLLLSNGLQVLLVSDSITESSLEDEFEKIAIKQPLEDEKPIDKRKLAAVALMVDVGAFSQPKEFQGLPHFLEHMIFMGSRKYPTENSFFAYMRELGGCSNAVTTYEESIYYFEVHEEHLESTLYRFIEQLMSPLILKEAMTREREAIESEFQQELYNDGERRYQLLLSLGNKNYPHCTFGCGNLKSLKDQIDDDDLHKILHEFYKRHYSGHRMYACIQANLPMEELENLAVKHFTDIPNNKLPGIDFSVYDYRQAFRAEFYNEVFFVKPISKTSYLDITWVLPSTIKLYKCKPDSFLAYLIGHEGKGSLCAYLRKKLWSLDLYTSSNTNRMFSLLNLGIHLTASGFEHLDEVLNATFSYIQLFSHANVLKSAYDECSRTTATDFRFASETSAYANVQYLVKCTRDYPAKDTLTGSVLYFEFNEEQVNSFIKHLNEFNFNITISSYHKYDGISYDKREKWYDTEYTSIKMPNKWRDLWYNCKPMPELFLPEPNRFVSHDFRILWLENGKPEIPLAPKKILQSDICELWFRQDDKFLLPDGYMSFYFISPLVPQNPLSSLLCSAYVHLINYHLADELYSASLAGLNCDLGWAKKGVILTVSGYNEKLHLVVDLITEAMVSIRKYIIAEQLEVFTKLREERFFSDIIDPETLNGNVHSTILDDVNWSFIEEYKCLSEISLENVLEFADKFTKELYIRALIQGNLNEDAALTVMNSILSTLNCQNIKQKKFIKDHSVELPLGEHYVQCNNLNAKDDNTVVNNFYQIGPRSMRDECILKLLMIIWNGPLYDSLRTKEQLGYCVGCGYSINNGIIGYSIYVHSRETQNAASIVEERIESFHSEMIQMLEEKEFDNVKESLIKHIQVVDTSLFEETDRNWEEIYLEEYLFDRIHKEIEVLHTLEKQDIIDFSLKHKEGNLRKLSIQVIGNNKNQSKSEEIIKENEENESKDNKEQTNEDLLDNLENKLNLKFMVRDGDHTTFVNINDFKENLNVYPMKKTILETHIMVNEPANRFTPEDED